MAQLNLRKLSAPIEALRPDVEAAYKRLDDQWKQVVGVLKDLPIPCNVSAVVWECPHSPEDFTTLEWRKGRGGRRLCIVTHYLDQTPYGIEPAENPTPYEEWSAEQRLEMLDHVPALFQRAEEQIKAFVEKTDSKEN